MLFLNKLSKVIVEIIDFKSDTIFIQSFYRDKSIKSNLRYQIYLFKLISLFFSFDML